MKCHWCENETDNPVHKWSNIKGDVCLEPLCDKCECAYQELKREYNQKILEIVNRDYSVAQGPECT